MPSATDEVKAAVRALFPGSEDVYGSSLEFLRKAGFVFCNHGTIVPPKAHAVTEAEGACLDYLWQEWDYGYGEKCEGCDQPKPWSATLKECRARRLAKGLTQTGSIATLNIEFSSASSLMSHFEAGRKIPSDRILRAYAAAIGLDPESLVVAAGAERGSRRSKREAR